MTLALLFLLPACSFLAWKLNRRRLAKGLGALAAAWAIGVGWGLVPLLLLNGLQVHEPVLTPEWKSKNAIVLLGGGVTEWPRAGGFRSNLFVYSRTHEAARLHTLCKAAHRVCHVLMSGGDPKNNGISEAAVLAQDLRDTGVPETDLVFETESRNTFKNAQYSREILRAGGYDQVYLVTSGFHMSRALKYFTYFLVPAIPAPADHLRTHHYLMPSSYNAVLTDLALHEILGQFQFWYYNALGWNPAVTR